MRERVIETHEGIQDKLTVETFDEFAKYMRDKGWIETKQMIESGVKKGEALEIGPGSGIKGLEWLKFTKNTTLTALEISENMIEIAKKNAIEYRLTDRVKYIHHNAIKAFPFEDDTFDAVFSNGSLHEWEKPENIFDEMYRVLKPGGIIFVSDMRRDIAIISKLFMQVSVRPRSMVNGFKTSLNAAYTKSEITEIIKGTNINQFVVKNDFSGMSIIGKKH